MKRKSIKQWIKELPDPYKDQALAIVDNEQWLNKTQVSSAKEALIRAFIWRNTPQGTNYWNELYEKL